MNVHFGGEATFTQKLLVNIANNYKEMLGNIKLNVKFSKYKD